MALTDGSDRRLLARTLSTTAGPRGASGATVPAPSQPVSSPCFILHQVADSNGGQGRNRTTDTRIFSPGPKTLQRLDHP